MGVVVALAMREAIVAARKESGIPSNKWFDIGNVYAFEVLYIYIRIYIYAKLLIQ